MRMLARSLTLALLAAACSPSVRRSPSVAPSESRSISQDPRCERGRAFVIVRHAEKASTERDAPLTDRGRARAEAIAAMLARTGVTRLVATEYLRTQQTLAPLAARLSLDVEVRPANQTLDLVRELRASPDGAVVVVATHSNVLPMIVKELAGARLRGVEGDELEDDDYGRVVIVTEPCGAAPFVLELSSDGA